MGPQLLMHGKCKFFHPSSYVQASNESAYFFRDVFSRPISDPAAAAQKGFPKLLWLHLLQQNFLPERSIFLSLIQFWVLEKTKICFKHCILIRSTWLIIKFQPFARWLKCLIAMCFWHKIYKRCYRFCKNHVQVFFYCSSPGPDVQDFGRKQSTEISKLLSFKTPPFIFSKKT